MVSAKTVPDDHHQMIRNKPMMMMMIERKPLMLKDYLLDDLSSCSSNGFKSFPRRQCCSTVRLLLEIDLKHHKDHQRSNNNMNKSRLLDLRRSRSRSAASTTISALQRASDVVINAVKQFPFRSVKSSSSRKGLLPRSLSRKLLKNRFWGKPDNNNKDIKRSRLFTELQERDHHEPSDQNAATKTVVTASLAVSTSTSSNSKSNSNSNSSWCESEREFTSSGITTIYHYSESSTSASAENDISESENDVSQKKVNNNNNTKKEDTTVGDDSSEGATTATCSLQNAKEWPNEEDKEQFSPVSVLDCRFEDDDQDETSSPFHRRLARFKGTKQKLLQKIRRFQSLTQLEPVDLEKRIAMSEHHRDESTSTVHEEEEEEDRGDQKRSKDRIEEKARELAKLVELRSTEAAAAANNKFLFDFFRERMADDGAAKSPFAEAAALKAAEHWAAGAKTREVLLGWEVKEGRKAYVRDMEKGGRWRTLDEVREEIGLDMEAQVWDFLLHDLLLDLS